MPIESLPRCTAVLPFAAFFVCCSENRSDANDDGGGECFDVSLWNSLGVNK